MIILGLLSLILLLTSNVIIITWTKLKEYHQVYFFSFILIQVWFSVQWFLFLGFDKLLISNPSNDSFGLFLANASILLPLAFIYISKRDLSFKRFLLLTLVLMFSSFSTVIIHALLSSPCVYCAFTPENENIILNLGFQLIVDLILLVGFGFILFDKDYRIAKNKSMLSSIGSVFTVFYINDILVLLSRITADQRFYSMEVAMWVEVLLYLLFSIGVFYLSLMIRQRGNEVSIARPNHFIIDLDIIDPEWSTLKSKLQNPETIELANTIDQLRILTKTEKLYLFLSHFNDIPNKTLSDLLSVSLRTVETNKYRLKKKLEKENIKL